MLGNMKQISKFYLRQIGENEINPGSQGIHYPTPQYIYRRTKLNFFGFFLPDLPSTSKQNGRSHAFKFQSDLHTVFGLVL